MPDFEDLEKLVAKIQSELAPTADILHNQKLPGRYSGTKRQIDVLVKDRVGQYDIMIVIDCKDYKKRVDVKGVEEFHGLVQDVGAHKGVLVCPKGFTDAAKTRAAYYQMDLYSPIDTAPHKWTVNPLIPAIVDFRSAAISCGITTSSPHPFEIPYDFHYTKQVTDADGVGRGSMFATTIKKWNTGELPVDPGKHEDLVVFEGDTYMENGQGIIVPMSPLISISVERELYFGHLPITQITGFKDEIGGGIISNGFGVGIVSADDVTESWQRIETEEECEEFPSIKIQGLFGWDEKDPETKSVNKWNDSSEFEHLFWGARPKAKTYEEVMGHDPSPMDAILGKGELLRRKPFGF